MKPHLLSYFLFASVFICGYFLITAKMEFAQVNKQLSYQSAEINKISETVEKISDDISPLKSEIKSLNNRFQLFIDLFSSSEDSAGHKEEE